MAYYTTTEPHPTVAQNAYTSSGRGGAGNIFRAPVTTTPAASGVPTGTHQSSSSNSGRFFSGRGGAGNAHVAGSERPVIWLEEEYLARAADARDKRTSPAGAVVGFVGRGGAGNAVVVAGGDRAEARKGSDASSRGSDASSVRSGFWARLKGDRR